MENSNNFNLLNSKSQKELKISSKNKDEDGFSRIKISLKDFPTLNSLYDKNYNLENNKNSKIKRCTTEDFKRNKKFSKVANKFLFEEKNIHKTQIINTDINKTKFNKNKKENGKNKINLEKAKKKYNNKKEKNKTEILKSIPNYIQKDSLINVISVREAKELKKAKQNLKGNNKNTNKPKPKIQKFENNKLIKDKNEEINFEPKPKVIPNFEFSHQFDKQIAPITNKRFKNLEMKKESEEKININPIKRFDNIDICNPENDLQIIHTINNEINNTINENITIENINNKIRSKNGIISEDNMQNINEDEQNTKKFLNLEINKEDLFIIANNNDKNNIINNNNIFDNNQDINNNDNINNQEQVIDLEKNKDLNINNNNSNIIDNEIKLNNSNNFHISINNENNQKDINSNNDINQERTIIYNNDEFSDNNSFPNIYPNLDINKNMNDSKKQINYSQINNQYDSDSIQFNNYNNTLSSVKRNVDSSIEPISMDTENYSRLIGKVENKEFNIYNNENYNLDNNNNKIISQENNKITDNEIKMKNKIVFSLRETKLSSRENKLNCPNNIEINNDKSKNKTNILKARKIDLINNKNKISNKINNKRYSDQINNKTNSQINSSNSNSNCDINIYKNINTAPFNYKENDQNSNQDIIEKNDKIRKYLSNPNHMNNEKVNNLNKISQGSNKNKKNKIFSDKKMNNKSKNNEDTYNSLYINLKYSLINGSRKSTEKQEEIK